MIGEKIEIREGLGRGAYGMVFKDTDERSVNVVVIKQVSLAGMSRESL